MTPEEASVATEAENDIYDEDDELQEDKYLTFRIASEDYGMNVLDVVEILRMIKITNIPESLKYIKGIINLRGKIIPVMNVRVRFGLDEIDYDDEHGHQREAPSRIDITNRDHGPWLSSKSVSLAVKIASFA